MHRMTARTAALAGTILFACARHAGANCGAEGCPLSPYGLEGSDRSWSFDVGYQYIAQDRLWNGTREASGHEEDGHTIERFTRSKIWTLNGRTQVLPSLRITGILPYVERRHAHEHELHPGHLVPSQWEYEGLGDATLLAHWRALGAPGYGAGALTIQAGAKLPTGKRHVELVDGEEPEPPARLGSGSTDVIAGLQLMRHFSVPAPGGASPTLPLVLSALGRWNGRGTDDYRMGDEWHVSLSSAYNVWSRVSLLGQVNALFHGRDEAGTTHAEPHHTGGRTVFATPGVRVVLPGGSAVYGYWQARLYEDSNGPQLIADDHWILGVSYGLGR